MARENFDNINNTCGQSIFSQYLPTCMHDTKFSKKSKNDRTVFVNTLVRLEKNISRISEINKNSFFLSSTDIETNCKIVNSFKSKKRCGHKNISTAFTKRAIIALKVPQSILINKYLSNWYITDLLKIIPIHKIKNQEIYTNYRPSSLLPSISKILEKVVHNRLCNFINSNQYRFRPKYSTINAITVLRAHITESLDNEYYTFLELSKAFDTIIMLFYFLNFTIVEFVG